MNRTNGVIGDPPLKLVDLTVRYGALVALRKVCLEVGEGEVLGVLGHNGAGKSSLAQVIVGTVRGQSGEIFLDGVRVDGLPTHRRTRLGLALSPEGRGVLGPLTVLDNLLLGTYACGRLSRREVASRLDDIYDLFPVLRERRQQQSSTLSGGEAAMLSIGRALMAKPRVLILDEPSLGLAPILTTSLFDRLRVLRDNGQSILLVEQRADLVDLADRILVMRRGEVIAEVATSETTSDVLRDLYFGNMANLNSRDDAVPTAPLDNEWSNQ